MDLESFNLALFWLQTVLFTFCSGNELFFASLYLAHFGSGFIGQCSTCISTICLCVFECAHALVTATVFGYHKISFYFHIIPLVEDSLSHTHTHTHTHSAPPLRLRGGLLGAASHHLLPHLFPEAGGLRDPAGGGLQEYRCPRHSGEGKAERPQLMPLVSPSTIFNNSALQFLVSLFQS